MLVNGKVHKSESVSLTAIEVLRFPIPARLSCARDNNFSYNAQELKVTHF